MVFISLKVYYISVTSCQFSD